MPAGTPLAERLKHTYLVRTFSRKEFADEARRGRLRLGSVRFYKEHEDSARRDSMEGAYVRGPGKHFHIRIGDTLIPDALDIQIDPPHEELDTRYLLCLYSFSWTEIAKYGVFRLPKEIRKFGGFCVGINALNLVGTLQRKFEQDGTRFAYGFVSYMDDEYHGEWGIFRKNHRYAHEREFRIVVEGVPAPEKILWLNVDFGTYMDVAKVDYSFHLCVQCPCCHGEITGTLAPLKTRRRRVQKKLEQRLGGAHHFQRCRTCRRRFYVSVRGDSYQLHQADK